MTDFPPGPRAFPLVGHSSRFRDDRLGFLTRLHREHGPTATFRLGSHPVCLFTRPETIQEILADSGERFANRDVIRSLRFLLGETLRPPESFSPWKKIVTSCCGCTDERGLLATDGEEHAEQRRIVQPAFHQRLIERYAGVMSHYTQQMLSRWRGGEQVDLFYEMRRLTLQAVTRALLGVELGDRVDELLDAYTYLSHFSTNPLLPWQALPFDLPLAPIHRYRRAWETVESVVEEVVARQTGESEGGLVQALMSGRDAPLSEKQLRAHLFLFLDSGHATTSSALAWTFYLLSQHPQVRQDLVDELLGALRGQAPSAEILAGLPLLDCTVKESLRLYPPIWCQARRTTREAELEGYRLPPRTFVVVSQWVTHRLADYFPEPERFLPERFAKGRPPPPVGAYFPFGVGPHHCAGGAFAAIELKLVVASVLQQFVPEFAAGHQVHPETRSMTLQPRDGLPVMLRRTSRSRPRASAPAESATQAI